MEKIKRFLVQDGPVAMQFGVQKSFQDLFARQPLASAALAINAAAAATWKMGNTSPLPYLVNGVMGLKTAATAQAVPAGITWAAVASTFQAAAFHVGLDVNGNVATFPSAVSVGSSQANALAGIIWPVVPEQYCVIGTVVIYNTAANTAFTANTTALDAANIGTQYINYLDAFYAVTPV